MEKGGFNVKLYTFGAPRVGHEDYSQNLTRQVKQENIFRVFHTTDPVPMIAPYPYVHAPFTSMEKLNWGLCCEKPGRIIPGDHSMSIYIQTDGIWLCKLESNECFQYADSYTLGNVVEECRRIED